MTERIVDVDIMLKDGNQVFTVKGKVRVYWKPPREGGHKFGGVWKAEDYPKGEEFTEGTGGSWAEAIVNWAMQNAEEKWE